jgi:putative peptidoglycan lipid II flippase
MHNVGLVAGVLAARLVPPLGILGPTLGVVAGAILQLCVLLPGLRRLEFRYRPRWNWRDHHLRDVMHLMVPIALSAALGYSGFIVDTAFASMAPEPQAVPAIYNAWLLVTLPISLLGKAVAQSVFPRLARHAAIQDWQALHRTLVGAVLGSAGLTVPLLLMLLVGGRPIIHLLFEHGRFDAAAGSLTYSVLAVYALSLPAYVGAEVIVRGLIAVRDTRTPLLADTAQLVARALLMAVLLERIGLLAIPAAVAATVSLETLGLGIVLLLRVRARATRVALAA